MADLAELYNQATATTAQQMAIGAAVALVILIGATTARRLRPWTASLRPKAILTPNEKDFFYRLLRAVPTHHVFAQVSFSAIIALDPQLSAKQQFQLRRRYGWKVADFVICKPDSFDILAIVELDDQTHVASADRKRDAIMSAAGYQTLRFQSRRKPSVADLTELFTKLAPTREKAYYA